jgi:hypothetical protein
LPPPESRNRRRVARHPIPGVEATLRAPSDVKVLNLSLFGLALEAPAHLPVGSRVCLELRHGNDRVNVEVAVRWSSVFRMERLRGTFVPISRAGVVFCDIHREAAAGIWEWICVPPEQSVAQ